MSDMGEGYRRMVMSFLPSERVLMAGRMFSTAMTLVRAGFDRGEGLSLRQRAFLRFYGRDFRPAEQAKILKTLETD